MNVEKVNRLSGIHRTLSRFHKQCCHNDVELNARIVTNPTSEVVLGSSITQLIIDKVQKALLGELEVLEKEIKETANG